MSCMESYWVAGMDKHMKKMQIKIINKKKMGLGIGLILLGLVSPALINVRNFHVYDLLYAAVYNDDTLALFISSIFLVLMNTLRIVPEYSGIFFSAESLTFLYRGKKNIIVPAVFAYTSMRLVYFVIEQIYRIRLDFGIPSLLVIALLLLFERINYQHIGT